MGKYFATVARGLEALAAQELSQLGAKKVKPGFCGVAFQGDRLLLYRVNLWARLPFRVLQRLDSFPCQTAEDLYRGIAALPWSDYLTPDYSLAVTATGKTPQLNHTHFTALQVKNAIVDQQRQQFRSRSPVDLKQPDVRVNVHLDGDRCVVSLDSSGESLHRRGYRPAVGAAPLKESLAAALLQISDWHPDQTFYDPLCGSGTLPLEACMRALNIAPGLQRDHFGFQTWMDFDAPLWQRLVAEAKAQQQSQLPAKIVGSDRDRQVIQQAQINADRCGVAPWVTFRVQDLADIEPPAAEGVVFCNPPYGDRLGKDEDLGQFYRLLGQVLKTRFQGWTAYILSGNKLLAQSIGLRSSARVPVYNGPLACQLMKYELFT
ncbi:THUMP domain-containing class I SAM-dependent RNA methyltransferase [Lyngbya confervoides]|uniref:THUMP domain-containing protein n=1 Tax=Lyngbya confervoides BDU141951 TaxID=1574623 RepID=A0ABD4T619_9CYAN|nr:THUMP domain-containing protein [Lyngbya confervoides]MCM1984005.1 THUMP domain-containing protein [Lyngbya confervoides BDU141951]